MLPERTQAAWDAIRAAQARAAASAPVEQALIAALAQRYKGPEWLDPPSMQPFHVAYASAMGEVAQSFPEDDDVQVLWAAKTSSVTPTTGGRCSAWPKHSARNTSARLGKTQISS